MNVDKPMETGKEVAPRGLLQLPFIPAIFMLVDLLAVARHERIRDFHNDTFLRIGEVSIYQCINALSNSMLNA